MSYAEVIKKITILGNERVADETVVIFSKLKIGENLNQIVLNKAIKELYSKLFQRYKNFFRQWKCKYKFGRKSNYSKNCN